MKRPELRLGWYVHHHGSGHLQRFLAVRAHLPGVVGLSSLPRPAGFAADAWVSLAPDAPAEAEAETLPQAGGALHWAPLRHPGLADRMTRIAAWTRMARPEGFVCDVSVEVATFVRLTGVPVVWIAQRGRRVDAPHRLAYAITRVIAPWTRELATPGSGLPDDACFVGALSRYDGRPVERARSRRRALVLLGTGGHAVRGEDVVAAAAATPGWSWAVAGLGEPVGGEVTDHGWTPDVWPLLAESDVVIASASTNLVAEVAAARRALVCLPQQRPFDEQHDQASALGRAGLAEAVEGWPAPRRWPSLLERALARDPDRWGRLHDGQGAERLADAIRERL